MNVVTSVIMSRLTETILIAKLFPFCCQVSTKYKHICFPITAKFKKLYNEKAQKRNKLSHYFNQSSQQAVRTLIKLYICLGEK